MSFASNLRSGSASPSTALGPVGGLPEMRNVTWPSWSPVPVYVDELPAAAAPVAPPLRLEVAAQPVAAPVPQVEIPAEPAPRKRRRPVVVSDEPAIL